MDQLLIFKGQNLDQLLTLQHIYIYICMYIHTYIYMDLSLHLFCFFVFSSLSLHIPFSLVFSLSISISIYIYIYPSPSLSPLPLSCPGYLCRKLKMIHHYLNISLSPSLLSLSLSRRQTGKWNYHVNSVNRFLGGGYT